MDIKKLKEAIAKITPEEIEEFFSQFPVIPHGWVDIKEHLPQVYASDYVNKGYSSFKVKDINGRIKRTKVCDGMIWFHIYAEPNNITHWWNKYHPQTKTKTS